MPNTSDKLQIRLLINNHSAERYSTTVLVDIAVQLLQLQQEKSVDPLVSSMKQLNLEVEEVLNEE